MTPAQVRKQVAEIRKVAADDDEQAHILEDRLYRDVLTEIASGAKPNA